MLMAPSGVGSRFCNGCCCCCCTQLSDQTSKHPQLKRACWTNRHGVVHRCMRASSSHRAALQQSLFKNHQTIWCGDKRSQAHRPSSIHQCHPLHTLPPPSTELCAQQPPLAHTATKQTLRSVCSAPNGRALCCGAHHNHLTTAPAAPHPTARQRRPADLQLDYSDGPWRLLERQTTKYVTAMNSTK